MITLINAVMITGLFSFWIWNLKQDILRLQQPEGPSVHAESKPQAHDADETLDMDEHQPRHALHRAYQNTKTRNRAGIPTWTIG